MANRRWSIERVAGLYPPAIRGDAPSLLSPIPTGRNNCRDKSLDHSSFGGTCSRSLDGLLSRQPQLGGRPPPWIASNGSLFGRRLEVGARIDLEVFAVHVIPRERHGLDVLEKLNLKYGESVISERCLETGQVVFPHPDESLRAAEPLVQLWSFVKQPDDLVALGKEVGPPCTQRFRVMEAQDLDIADDQARFFDNRGKFDSAGV